MKRVRPNPDARSVLRYTKCGTCLGLGMIPAPDETSGTLFATCKDCKGSGTTQ